MKISDIEVKLIHHVGDDLDVVDAARVSFNKQSEYEEVAYDDIVDGEYRVFSRLQLSDKDKKLINYLAKHKHHSPFNHSFLSFRVKAPIFVARQLVKHKFLPWNEVSRRYVDSEPEFYVPSIWRKKAENVKQGSSEEAKENFKSEGKCLYCGEPLPPGRRKYCSNSHQARHYEMRFPKQVRFSRWRASAKAQEIDFTITEDDLDWPVKCPYLDIELNYSTDNLSDNVASLDKIVPELGYVPGNVQIISNLANKMKSSASKEQILTFSKNAALMHGGVFVNSADSYEKYLSEISETYMRMIGEGYCAEQARMILPLSAMTEWRWSGTLGAFLDMLVLRLDPHTQQESRVVAYKIYEYVKELFPVSTEAYLGVKIDQP